LGLLADMVLRLGGVFFTAGLSGNNAQQ